MKALDTVRRLRKMSLDHEAVFLAEIREEEAQVERSKAAAIELLKRDTSDIPVEYTHYIGSFIKAMYGEIRGLDDRLASLANQAHRQQRVVMREYSDFRSIDIHIEKKIEEAAEEEKKRENSELDEISLLKFRRGSLY